MAAGGSVLIVIQEGAYSIQRLADVGVGRGRDNAVALGIDCLHAIGGVYDVAGDAVVGGGVGRTYGRRGTGRYHIAYD